MGCFGGFLHKQNNYAVSLTTTFYTENRKAALFASKMKKFHTRNLYVLFMFLHATHLLVDAWQTRGAPRLSVSPLPIGLGLESSIRSSHHARDLNSRSRRSIVLYSVDGDGSGGVVKQTLNILKQGAGLASAFGDEEFDEEEIERQLQEEEAEAEELRLQRLEQKNTQKKKDSSKDDEKSDGGDQQSVDLFQISKSILQESPHKNLTASNNGNVTNSEDATFGFELQRRLDAFDRRAKRTRIILLKRLALWAFDVCATTTAGGGGPDNNSHPPSLKRRRVDRNAFYSGILLVHLHLAKYVGVAACHPPTRDQIDELFQLADHDRSGTLNEEEFTNAVIVACIPITSRIVTYWSLLAVLPILVARTGGVLARVMRGSINSMPTSLVQRSLAIAEWAVEYALQIIFFSILVPNIFSRIDKEMRSRARAKAKRRNQNTSLWWLRMPSSQHFSQNENGDSSSSSLGKNKNGDDWNSNLSYWGEALGSFLPQWDSLVTPAWKEQDQQQQQKRRWKFWSKSG